ncbi:MAG: GNAT family N-acetyltransferase [Proteobacteria bacterium]|nr:GNAT family N-acetyltransferase [Pseudomonadota bacterium]
MHIRPLEEADRLAAAAIRVRPDVAPYLGVSAQRRPETCLADLRKGHVLGAFRDGQMVAVAQLRPSSRMRMRHVASVDLYCGAEGIDEAEALAAHLVYICDHWLQLWKLELAADPEAPWLEAAHKAGFELEQTRRSRRWRAGESRDELLLGWVQSGLRIATPTSASPLPPRLPKRPITLRPAVPDDAERFATLHHEDSVLRGTLQTPLRNADTWRGMLGGDQTAASLVAEIDGRLVGSGALFAPGGPAHQTGVIGLSVETASQGCGAGTAIMRELIRIGRDDLGLRRIELEVDAENVGARGLYAKLGFVEEGLRRQGSWRIDGYASAISMAIVYRS